MEKSFIICFDVDKETFIKNNEKVIKEIFLLSTNEKIQIKVEHLLRESATKFCSNVISMFVNDAKNRNLMIENIFKPFVEKNYNKDFNDEKTWVLFILETMHFMITSNETNYPNYDVYFNNTQGCFSVHIPEEIIDRDLGEEAKILRIPSGPSGFYVKDLSADTVMRYILRNHYIFIENRCKDKEDEKARDLFNHNLGLH